MVKPSKVTLPLKVTVPVAAVLFCKVKVLEAPVTVPLKLIAPAAPLTVTLAFKTTSSLKVIAPPADETLAPRIISPVPAVLMVMVLALEVEVAPLTLILELPTLAWKSMVRPALMVEPLTMSIPAVASAPLKPVKLEPMMTRSPPAATEPVAVT